MEAWVNHLTKALPSALSDLSESFKTETESYRSLMTAYTYEKELLFRMDTNTADGFFAVDYQALQRGEMMDNRRLAIGKTLADAPAHLDLWESLCRVSKGTGALYTRIKGRGADRRMARELSEDPAIRLAALRASAYEDEDWGDSVVEVMDHAMRREYMDTVRRFLETRELTARRAEVFAAYSAAWQAYLPDGCAAGK